MVLKSRRLASTFFALMALAVGMLIPIRIYAQVSGATLAGPVNDASGGVIPNAQLSINNVATDEVRMSTTF
jgi:hypothetical protein